MAQTPQSTRQAAPAGVTILGEMKPGFETVLTPEAVDFIVGIERKFRAERKRLLARRTEVQARLDAGERRGAVTIDGTQAFVSEIALALKLWTGVDVNEAVLRDAAEEFMGM